MRKVISSLMILIIMFYSSSVLAVVKVHDLYPNYKEYKPASKIFSVPAKLMGVSGTNVAVRTVVLDLAKSAGAGLFVSLAIAGAGYLANEGINYLLSLSPPMYYGDDGELVKDVEHQTTPPACDADASTHMFNTVAYTYGSENVINEGVCYSSAGTCTVPSGYSFMTTDNGFYNNGCQFPIQIYSMWTGYATNQKVHIWGKYYASEGCYVTSWVPEAVTSQELQNQVDNSIESDTDGSAPIIEVVNQAIDKAADLVNNGEGIRAKSPSVAYSVENVLNSAISQEVANDMAEDLATETDVTDLSDVVKDEQAIDNELTAEEVEEALRNVFDDMITVTDQEELGALSALPEVGEPEEKGTIATIVNTFLNGLANLPIISFFTNMKNISFSGSCSTTFPIPNFVGTGGGDTTVDFCQFQDIFAIMGSILLSVTGIVWTMYLFEG